jgi:hypothetical protein
MKWQTLVYYDTVIMTGAKSFIVQTHLDLRSALRGMSLTLYVKNKK